MQAGILEGKQGSALGFELVDEPSAGVGKENVPQCIDGECHGLIEFARTFALVTPRAEEFEWWRRLRFRRRAGSPCVRRDKQCDEQGNQPAPPLPIGGIQFSRAQRFRFENRLIPPEESYHARSKRLSRRQETSCRKGRRFQDRRRNVSLKWAWQMCLSLWDGISRHGILRERRRVSPPLEILPFVCGKTSRRRRGE